MDTVNNAAENGKAEEVNFTEILVEFFVHKNETMTQLLERVYKLGQKSSEAALSQDYKNLEKLVVFWKELCDARLKTIGDKDMALFSAQNENDKLQEDCAEYRLLIEEKKELIEDQCQKIEHLKIASESLRKAMLFCKERCDKNILISEEKDETIANQRRHIEELDRRLNSTSFAIAESWNRGEWDKLTKLTFEIRVLVSNMHQNIKTPCC